MKYIVYTNVLGEHISPVDSRFIKFKEKYREELIKEKFISEIDKITFVPNSKNDITMIYESGD